MARNTPICHNYYHRFCCPIYYSRVKTDTSVSKRLKGFRSPHRRKFPDSLMSLVVEFIRRIKCLFTRKQCKKSWRVVLVYLRKWMNELKKWLMWIIIYVKKLTSLQLCVMTMWWYQSSKTAKIIWVLTTLTLLCEVWLQTRNNVLCHAGRTAACNQVPEVRIYGKKLLKQFSRVDFLS